MLHGRNYILVVLEHHVSVSVNRHSSVIVNMKPSTTIRRTRSEADARDRKTTKRLSQPEVVTVDTPDALVNAIVGTGTYVNPRVMRELRKL